MPTSNIYQALQAGPSGPSSKTKTVPFFVYGKMFVGHCICDQKIGPSKVHALPLGGAGRT